MDKIDLGEIEGQFGLMLREKANHDNYVLIRFEDLKSIIKYYEQFKEEFDKWDAKFVLVHTRILLEINYGMNNKFVDFVVKFVITLLGMEIIYTNIGGMEIEMS